MSALSGDGTAVVRGPNGRGPRTKAAKARAEARARKQQQARTGRPQRDDRNET